MNKILVISFIFLLGILFIHHLSPFFLPHFINLITLGKISFFNDPFPVCTPPEKLPSQKVHPCLSNNTFLRINAFHNEATTKLVLEKALKDGCPVVIEQPFRDHDCLKRIMKVAEDRVNTVRVKDNWDEIYEKREDWFYSDNFVGITSAVSTIMPLQDLLDEVLSQPSRNHLSFERSLITSYEDIWGFNMTWMKGISSSNFISHYNQTVVTSPFHSALWDSVAYQCEGTKRWYFLHPEDNFATIRFFGTGFSSSQNCNGRKDVQSRMIDVTTGSDSLMYFPPYWAHGVQTEKGLSILLNYRILNLRRMLFREPFLAIHSFFGLILHGTFFRGWDPPEIQYFYRYGALPDMSMGKKQVSFLELVKRVVIG